METEIVGTDGVPAATAGGDVRCGWVKEMDCEWTWKGSHLTCTRCFVGQNQEKEWIDLRMRRRRDSWTKKRKDSVRPLGVVGVVLSW